jgi:hypothetical protein
MSKDTVAEFATIPPEVTLKKLFEVVQQAVTENVPLVETVQQLRADGWTDLPAVVPASPADWTPVQARALAEIVRLDEARRVWMGSIEITELIRRHLQQDVSSAGLAARPGPPEKLAGAELPLGGVSSLFAEEESRPGAKPFWLNLNAELILYGATETDATVTIGERQIRLRPDGTFSFRFALPDGEYGLTVRARSAEGGHARSAELHFSRSTQYQGHVGAQAQDPHLRPPVPAAVA